MRTNGTDATITYLRVFYDAECGLCRACRHWMKDQPKFVEVLFTPYQSGNAERLCSGLHTLHPDRQIVVLADNGAIYQGGSAWVMCLWALRDYRELAGRLATPAFLPFAKKACALVSKNRLRLSSLFRLKQLESAEMPDCEDGACALPKLQTAKAN
ncbi:MAG: DCC1-like thiol-disulfide oxidoreductase family protein [Verrucomicrobiota bacterium]